MSQADVVAQLRRKPMTVTQLALALDTTYGRAQATLNALIAKGMVEQGPLGGYRLVERRAA